MVEGAGVEPASGGVNEFGKTLMEFDLYIIIVAVYRIGEWDSS